MDGMWGRGCAAGEEYRIPFLSLLSRIGKEEFMHHPCQLGSPSHFLTLSLGPQASLPLVTHKTLLQGPLAFCLHPCIIHHVT